MSGYERTEYLRQQNPGTEAPAQIAVHDDRRRLQAEVTRLERELDDWTRISGYLSRLQQIGNGALIRAACDGYFVDIEDEDYREYLIVSVRGDTLLLALEKALKRYDEGVAELKGGGE